MNAFFTYIFRHSYYNGVKEFGHRICEDLNEATKIWLYKRGCELCLDTKLDFNLLSWIYDNRGYIFEIKTNLEKHKDALNQFPKAVEFIAKKNKNEYYYDDICYITSLYKNNILSQLSDALSFIETISTNYTLAWNLYSKGQDVSSFSLNEIINLLSLKEEFFSTKEDIIQRFGNNKKLISLIGGKENYNFANFDEETQIIERKALLRCSIVKCLPEPIDKRLKEDEYELLKKVILGSEQYGEVVHFSDSFSIQDFYDFRKKLDSYGFSFDYALNLVKNNKSVIKKFNSEHSGKEVVFIQDYYRVLDKNHPLYNIVHLSEQERQKRESLISRVNFIKSTYPLGYKILVGTLNPELLNNESLLEICNKSDEIIQKHQEEKKKEDERERVRIAQQLERERKRIEQQKKDKCKSLRMCIDSWTERIGDVPYFYLVKYFSIKDYGHVTDASIWQNRRLVWNFKNDPQKSVNPFAHDSARKEVVATLVCELQKRFKDKCSDLTLFCIPASTQLKTSRRYMQFAMEMHEKCGIISSFNQVKVIEDSVAKHDGGSGLQTVELDEAFFKDRYVIIFDDVVTSGSSMLRTKYRLEELGAFVIGCMSVGKTV